MKKQLSTLATSKLFQLLALVEEKEYKKVGKFLANSYFNVPKVAVQLFQILTTTAQKKRVTFTKEQLHHLLYPTESFKDDRVRLAMSQLVQYLEQYLLLKEWQADKIANKIQLVQLYQKKKADKLYHQLNGSTKQLLQKQPLRNTDFYQFSYQLALTEYQYASFTIRSGPQNLQEVSDLLDTAFIIEKLKTACLVVSHQLAHQQEYDFGLLEVILAYIENKKLVVIPAIGLYYYSYHALIETQPTNSFQLFKNLLFQHQRQFSPEELMDLYLMGINCCVRMVNMGNASFWEEIMSLYQKGLQSNALLENGVLSRFTYLNIASTGLRTKQYQWTNDFLTKYKPIVEKAYRESAYRFNKGRLAYQQKQYQEALDLLQDTDHKDLLVNLFSKTLLLKIYYELEEFKLLNSFLDSFQIYLRRKKDIGYHKENYQKVIYYAQQLMKVNPFDKEEKAALKNRILAEENLLEKEWVLEQLTLLN